MHISAPGGPVMSRAANELRIFDMQDTLAVPTLPDGVRKTAQTSIRELSDYITDAAQRSALFLDVLRQRGNAEIEITSRPLATVLRFPHEVLIDGLTLPRPINYSLLRILPLDGVAPPPNKRPVVVVDPRAGQGPGIGGFKSDSEIGDALAEGHPVYFLGFSATPAPGQQFLDVVAGQVRFFEHIVALHPDAPRPFAIGNCQAGYQTLMVAMLRPDLFGPCLVVGSPMSYWQGTRGKNPMRYAGGMLGGSWLTELTSDLGHGKFEGTNLVLNFDLLNPANWLWGKQYEVYANIDTDAERYLEFEKWWGDFISLGGDEIQYLVDNLFIGDKLARGELAAPDGTVFDVKNVTSPIIAFASEGDNISPPPQSLGWIADVYADDAAIRAAGRTIVYCLDQTVGHLGLFVSSRVGAKQDEEFVQMIDVIECLPPGLHEMIISPRPASMPKADFVPDDWISTFEPRTVDDIRALGRNSAKDDRAFAAVAKLSEINLAAYRATLQPAVRALSTETGARAAQALNPLRLGYTMFAGANPMMAGVAARASSAAANRAPVGAGNRFLAAQTRASNQIVAALDQYQIRRDRMTEAAFFGFYGSPLVQAMLGISPETETRPAPGTIPAERVAAADAGGFDEALSRAVLYVSAAERLMNPWTAQTLNRMRQRLMHLSLDAFKSLVRDQSNILQLGCERGVAALPSMVPDSDTRARILGHVEEIACAGEPTDCAARDRLAHLSATLPVPPEAHAKRA